MTKREWLERKKRRKRIRRIRMAIKITVYTLFALLVFGVVWTVAKPLVNKITSDDKKPDNQIVSEAETDQTVDDVLDPQQQGDDGEQQVSAETETQKDDTDVETMPETVDGDKFGW